MAARRSSCPPLRLAAVLLLASAPVAAPIAAMSQPALSASAATDGPDALVGGPGPDTLQGMAGADTVRGMEGADLVNGNGGDDSVGGGPGDDRVFGGQGFDNLNGGQGNDTVSGDRDNDTLAGGVGADLFVVSAGGGDDIVVDFDSAAGDRLVLPRGATAQVTDGPDGAVMRLSTGEAVTFRGVTAAGLGDWRSSVVTEALRGDIVIPTPRPAASRLLQVAILALGILFIALLGKGVIQLVNYRARPPR